MQELPPTENEYWNDADKNRVELSAAKPLLCNNHERVTLDVGKREIHCVNCSWGKVIRIQDFKHEGDTLKNIHTGKAYVLTT